MNAFVLALENLTGAFWGIPALVLFVGGGVYASIRLRFVQFRCLPQAFRLAAGGRNGKEGTNSFSALLASLGAVMGPGNIVGVASAILLGGPGAIFWMWVSAWIGMGLRYAESALAVKYRETDSRGRRGGAMYIFRAKNMGALAVLFSAAGIIVSLTMADAVPAAAVGAALKVSCNVPPVAVGIFLGGFTAIVVFGGAKRIIKASEIVVPLVCAFYFLLSLCVFVANPLRLLGALADIFKGAFSLGAGLGGLIGTAVRQGLAKGVFSHEAGMGTDPILAASTNEDDESAQGLVSMLGPFLDTVVFCSLTALVTLMSGEIISDPAAAVRGAFCGFFPKIGGWALDVTLVLLVLATLSSWAFYGEACVEYLSQKPVFKTLFRLCYCLVPVFAAGADLELLLLVGDLATAFMAVPNLVLCILFISEVKCPWKNRFISTSSVDKIGGKGYYIYTEKL